MEKFVLCTVMRIMDPLSYADTVDYQRYLKSHSTSEPVSFKSVILLLQKDSTSAYPPNTVKPCYNDIGLYDNSSIASDILSYQLILPR